MRVLHPSAELDHFTLVELEQDDFDLVALQFLAHRLRATLNRLEEHGWYLTPLVYHWKEPHQRMHRIVLYKDPHSFREKNLSFVGFLSKKQEAPAPMVSQNIVSVDKELVKELAANPWLLSYSSMELADGNWCNLVVFNQEEAKRHLLENSIHKYAASQLAPEYYEWVRLHNGTLRRELEEIVINTTKYYTFKRGPQSPLQQSDQQPTLRVHRYEQAEQDLRGERDRWK